LTIKQVEESLVCYEKHQPEIDVNIEAEVKMVNVAQD
jgi:hypothetical protein